MQSFGPGTRTHGAWGASAEAMPVLPSLDGEIVVDVAVIGAGYTGLAAALKLAESGTSVAVLEAQQVGFGCSGRNSGLVNAGLWFAPDDVVAGLGPEVGERLNEVLGGAPERVFNLIEQHQMACEPRRNGTLHCAHSPGGLKDLERRQAQWAARGANLEVIDRPTATEKIGSDRFHGALWDHRAGTIQPLGYAQGLAKAALSAGAALYCQSPVERLDREAQRWRLSTPKGRVRADKVVMATNAYSQGAGESLQQAHVPFYYFHFATDPLPEKLQKEILPEEQGCWDTHTVLTSFRKDAAGRLIFGSVGQLEGLGTNIHKGWARRTLKTFFPQAAKVGFAESWCGAIGMTQDHLPKISELQPGVVAAYAFNGRGIGPGTVFGQALADYLQSGDATLLPLPLVTQHREGQRALRSLGYEVGARAHHFTNRRF
ncbi:NAD(P)/FAD-dependent oxidoreductase [Rhodovibrionaceae bacterium A322]